ncbi:MAG: TonB-dependent receptor [Bacteroidota bacterium]
MMYWLWMVGMPAILAGQNPSVTGFVYTEHPDGSFAPLAGVQLSWLETKTGTFTDSTGYFTLGLPPEFPARLQIRLSGFQEDTISVQGNSKPLSLTMVPVRTLASVEISDQKAQSSFSFINPIKTLEIDEGELLKAACCNLSESFETNPSVDASYSDAITGTRQIQMLGLAGPYAMITEENMPSVRGLSSLYGLTFTPGTWVESMQLSKGTGSVLNGFESISGQINVELRKPRTAQPLYFNLYTNQMGRLEGNLNLAHRLPGGRWSTALLLHGQDNAIRLDPNGDRFLDIPLTRDFIGLHRWQYVGPKGLRFQAGVKGSFINQIGGRTNFDPEIDALGTRRWGSNIQIRQVRAWSKLGMVFPRKPWRSIALQASAQQHAQNSYFGLRTYDAQQRSLYANFIYQGMFGNTNHTFRTGASLMIDAYTESLEEVNFDRTEQVPGAYFEYTFKQRDQFSMVAGIRGDYHNLYGPFLTPRLHVRYAPDDKLVLRGSVGRGQRTANILAENNGLLASSRAFVIQGERAGVPYGLDPEVAWNAGLNLVRYFRLDYRSGSVSLDLYRTHFTNQIVVDREDPRTVRFYNLGGRSFSNSFQAQVDYELVKRVDMRLAYRFLDVQTTYQDGQQELPFVSRHRAFINLAYNTRSDWTYDLTVNWQGARRIPSTLANPERYQLAERSPSFWVVNAQVSKAWGDTWEVYLGGENLLNFRQEGPILANDSPFGPYFDASLIWGPIFGRMVYAGLRLRMGEIPKN